MWTEGVGCDSNLIMAHAGVRDPDRLSVEPRIPRVDRGCSVGAYYDRRRFAESGILAPSESDVRAYAMAG